MTEPNLADMTSREYDYQLIKVLSELFKDSKVIDYTAIQELLTIPGVCEFFMLYFYTELQERWKRERS